MTRSYYFPHTAQFMQAQRTQAKIRLPTITIERGKKKAFVRIGRDTIGSIDFKTYSWWSLGPYSAPDQQKKDAWWELITFEKDPAAAILKFGQETHSCCMCGRWLTNPESQAKGIGPECEGRLSR